MAKTDAMVQTEVEGDGIADTIEFELQGRKFCSRASQFEASDKDAPAKIRPLSAFEKLPASCTPQGATAATAIALRFGTVARRSATTVAHPGAGDPLAGRGAGGPRRFRSAAQSSAERPVTRIT